MSAESNAVLVPDWGAPDHVQVFNSTRLGGVSKAPYDSMNLGLHVADVESDVRKNRDILARKNKLPSEPHWLNQVHGTNVLSVTRDRVSGDTKVGNSDKSDSFDAAFTDLPDEVLCVMTADCLPVVITNSSGTKLAVAHAGWKGLAAGVLQNCLKKFSTDENIHVWLGPAIGPESFEVGNEVMAAFTAVDPQHEQFFLPHSANDEKKFADIYGLARRTVHTCWQRLGQNAANPPQAQVFISGGERCTVKEAALFHSYRRDGTSSGRMALFAWLAGK